MIPRQQPVDPGNHVVPVQQQIEGHNRDHDNEDRSVDDRYGRCEDLV